MKHLQKILPVVAVVAALGAAVYHVRASAAERSRPVERPAAAQASDASGAPGSTLPASYRTGASSAIGN
jgi:hypothetical protein